VGNLNPKDRHTTAKLVHEKELSAEDITEIKTLKGWIRRCSASSKKKMSEKALEQGAIEECNFVVHIEKQIPKIILNRAYHHLVTFLTCNT
jgi:hypothetical protein